MQLRYWHPVLRSTKIPRPPKVREGSQEGPIEFVQIFVVPQVDESAQDDGGEQPWPEVHHDGSGNLDLERLTMKKSSIRFKEGMRV